MRRFVALAWGLAACGQSVPPRPPAKAPESTSPAAAIGPVPHAPFAVVPAELGDDHVLDRIPHRAMVKRWSVAWLAENGPPIGDPARTERNEARDILPVLDERGKKIRIVVDDDKARFAAWIARDDAWSTVLVPLAIGSGVSVDPGVALEPAGARGAERRVAIIDDMLAAEGIVAARALGEVWVAPGQATQTRIGTVRRWQAPRSDRELVRLPRGASLRARAERDAPTIATVTADELVVEQLGTNGAFTEVLAERPYVHVHGFVETARVLGTTDDLVTSGSGTGRGFGMSHAIKHEVPAGTCLYDRPDGDVIGVTLEAESRLGGPLRQDGWAMVYLVSPWNVTSMYVKNIGTDPSAPVWDSCTEPVHRR